MRRILLAFLLIAVAPTAAGGARVQIVASGDGEPYATTSRELAAQLEPRGIVAERATLAAWRPDADVALVVALGSRAVEAALSADPRRPVFAALLPREAWERALAGAAPGPATALWLDHPFDRQLRLLTLVLPHARKVGAVLGPSTLAQRPGLERAATALGLELRVRSVDTGDDPARALGALMDEVDAVLALPEATVWNRVTVQPLLLATFRAGRPVIAFSPAYVRAGAVAAVHTTPSEVAAELAERIAALDLAAPSLGRAGPHARFEVATNPEVARALGLSLGDPEPLADRLRAGEVRR